MEFDDVWTIRLTRSIELEAGMTVATTPWGGSPVKIGAIDRRTKPGRTLVTFDNGDRRDLQTEHDGLPVRWEPAQVIFSYEASDSGSARFSTWVPGDDTLYHYSAEGEQLDACTVLPEDLITAAITASGFGRVVAYQGRDEVYR